HHFMGFTGNVDGPGTVGGGKHECFSFVLIIHVAKRRVTEFKSLHDFAVSFGAHVVALAFVFECFFERRDRYDFLYSVMQCSTNCRSCPEYVNSNNNTRVPLIQIELFGRRTSFNSFFIWKVVVHQPLYNGVLTVRAFKNLLRTATLISVPSV